MKLSGQCKVDFEKWVSQDSGLTFSERQLIYSLHLSPSMQYGVFVDFFDQNNLKIELKHNVLLNDFGFMISGYGAFLTKKNTHGNYHVYQNTDCDGKAFETRHQAREEAIKAANDIYNKK